MITLLMLDNPIMRNTKMPKVLRKNQELSNAHKRLLRALQARHSPVAHEAHARALHSSTFSPDDLSTPGTHFTRVWSTGSRYNGLSTMSCRNAITLDILWTSPQGETLGKHCQGETLSISCCWNALSNSLPIPFLFLNHRENRNSFQTRSESLK